MKKVTELKENPLSMLSLEMENKENGPLVVKHSVENGRPPDLVDWAVADVYSYFKAAGFEEQARAFQEQILAGYRATKPQTCVLVRHKAKYPHLSTSLQEIDGKSLLLMTRNDVLTGLALKLGPALKIYEYHVKPMQTEHLKNNSS
ncbi:sterile alpha motif domain-containing protein 13 isoform X2 [Ambystoma mexicanum]|uniref:sterile alpha motif domain-containing protein 13 isoform X2 n=1 Tax=Ambystoma mexicanum TaxID=8296 RepID=UPI0037E7F034